MKEPEALGVHGPAQHVSAKVRSVDIVWVSARYFGTVSADFGRLWGSAPTHGPYVQKTLRPI